MATGSDYFSFSSEVLIRTSSHMCGRWNLPMFLLRDGLLMFWSSLPTMLKFSMAMLRPVVLKWSYMGEGALRCSLNHSPKCSRGLSNILLITFHPVTFVSIDDSTFLLDGILAFWSDQDVLDGITSFKIHLHTMFPACLFEAFTDTICSRESPCVFLDVIPRVLLASAGFVGFGLGLHF